MIASIRALWRLRNFDRNDNENLGKINRVISGIHEKNRFEDHSAAIFGVSFSPKGSLIASAGDDKLIRLWKPDGTLIKAVSPMRHEKAIWTINFSSSGEFIASGDQNGTIKIWRKDGTLLDAFKGHTHDVNFIAFSPDDRKIVSASDDRTVKIWAFDLNSKRVLKKSPLILQHNSAVWMTTFSPDGHFIASAIDKRAINIWKSDGTLLTTLMGHTASVRYASFSSDSKALVSTSDDNTIRIWQWQKDQKHWTSKILTNKSNKGYTVRFSPDNQTIAASSANGTIQLWHSKDLSELIPFGRHLDQILDLAFSPDSKQIVTVSRDKTVRIWNLDSVNSESQISTDYLLVKSCSWLSDYLRTNPTAKRDYNDVVANCNDLKVPSK